jgi:hypothetical protein
MDLLQERNTPPAASARSAAFRQLARHARAPQPHEVYQLTASDVKTVTYLGIQIHSLHFSRQNQAAAQQDELEYGKLLLERK